MNNTKLIKLIKKLYLFIIKMKYFTVKLILYRNLYNQLFIQSIDHYKKSFEHFIYSLDLIHQLIILNILVYISIFLSVCSLITILYGDYLIRKFQLETKYPRVAIYLRYRAKVQYINYIWQVFSISFVLLVLIIMDILLLLRII